MFRYDQIPTSLFVENRKSLYKKMQPNSLVILKANDFFVPNSDGLLPFEQNSHLFYLSGIDQENVALILYLDSKNKPHEILFVIETSKDIAIWDGEKLTKEKAAEISGISRVYWLSEFDAIWKDLMIRMEKVYLTLNETFRSHPESLGANERFVHHCQKVFPLHDYKRIDPIMANLRSRKSELEIKQIQKAIDITESGYRRVFEFVRPNVGEWEIEAEFSHEFLKCKSRGFAYLPILASGKNSCVLHYIENSKTCQDGEILLIDVGAEWANWNADVTRCLPVNGKFSARQREVYEAVLRILHFSNELLSPDACPQEYQKKVEEKTGKELVKLGLIDGTLKGEEKQKAIKYYFMHGVSHHLGIDVHDVYIKEPFAEDMLLTIEPGIYIREENLGIRLEDDLLLKKKGNINLTQNIPIEADEIEQLMKG